VSHASHEAKTVGAELDAAHDRAHAAYAARNADAYMAIFHPTLAYTQLDGRTIGREQLARDVRSQLARVDTATSEFRREALELPSPGTATETLEERATFSVRAFGFLRREWSLSRRGRYEWVRTADTWQIRRVTVLSETLRGRFSVGRR
jgi:hypothetical protein